MLTVKGAFKDCRQIVDTGFLLVTDHGNLIMVTLFCTLSNKTLTSYNTKAQVFSRQFEGQTGKNGFKTVIIFLQFCLVRHRNYTLEGEVCNFCCDSMVMLCKSSHFHCISFHSADTHFFLSPCGWLWPILDRNSGHWTVDMRLWSRHPGSRASAQSV